LRGVKFVKQKRGGKFLSHIPSERRNSGGGWFHEGSMGSAGPASGKTDVDREAFSDGRGEFKVVIARPKIYLAGGTEG